MSTVIETRNFLLKNSEVLVRGASHRQRSGRTPQPGRQLRAVWTVLPSLTSSRGSPPTQRRTVLAEGGDTFIPQAPLPSSFLLLKGPVVRLSD